MKYSLLFIILLALNGLTIFISSCKETDPIAPPEDHAEASGLVLFQKDTISFKVFNGEIIGENKEFFVNESDTTDYYDIKFLDSTGTLFDLHGDSDKDFTWNLKDTGIAKIEQDTADIWRFRIIGIKKGRTEIAYEVLHLDHLDFTTPNIWINVQ